jgi:hypothetical protein
MPTQYNLTNLAETPPEILIIIYRYLDFRSLLSMRLLCCKFYDTMHSLSPSFSSSLECIPPRNLIRGKYIYKVLCTSLGSSKVRESVLYTYRIVPYANSIANSYSRLFCKYIRQTVTSLAQACVIISNEAATFRISPVPNHPLGDISRLLRAGHTFTRLVDGLGIVSDNPPLWQVLSLSNNITLVALQTSNSFQLGSEGILACQNWISDQLAWNEGTGVFDGSNEKFRNCLPK